MKQVSALIVAIPLAASALAQAQTPASPERMRAMFVVGCLAEENGKWMLTRAGDPVPVAGVPGSKTDNEPAVDAPLGKNRFSLIGTVEEFGVTKHKGHKVRVKGLVIKATPDSRINLTSLKMLGVECK